MSKKIDSPLHKADLGLLDDRHFLQIGMNSVAYIKPVQKGGLDLFGLYAANGAELGHFQTKGLAIQAAWANDLDPLCAH